VDDLVRRAAEDWERQRIAQGGYVFPAAIANWGHPLVQTRPYVDWAARSTEEWERQRLEQRGASDR